MQEVGENKGRTIRQLRPGAPTLLQKRRPRQAAVKVKRPWYDGGPGTPALPGEPCRTPPHPDWSEPEKWAWEQICIGEAADFGMRYGRTLDPTNGDEWNSKELTARVISTKFLQTILFHSPWKPSLHRTGVELVNALLPNKIELDFGVIESDLMLTECRVLESITAQYTTFSHNLSFEKSSVQGSIVLNKSIIGRNLSFREASIVDLQIIDGNIAGQLLTRHIFVRDRLLLDGIKVGSGWNSGDSQLKSIKMIGGIIRGQIDFSRLSCTNEVVLDGTTIDGNFYSDTATMDVLRYKGGLISGTFDSRNAKIDKVLLDRTIIEGSASFDEASIGEMLLPNIICNNQFKLCGVTILTELNGHGSKIKELYLTSARLAQTNLSFSAIENLFLSDNSTGIAWDKEASLKFKGSKIKFIYDRENIWPPRLDLANLEYEYLGTHDTEKPQTARSSKWFINWLAKQKDYSPQPYEQCAKVLREAGQPGKANAVLFAGKVRERKEAWKQNKWRWLGLWAMQATIGYGLGWRYWFSLAWVIPFTLIGAWVVSTTPLAAEHTWGWMLGYSFAKLIPLVNLGKNFEAVVHGYQQGYFIGHQIIGWALASFIVAGLAGLTKKS